MQPHQQMLCFDNLPGKGQRCPNFSSAHEGEVSDKACLSKPILYLSNLQDFERLEEIAMTIWKSALKEKYQHHAVSVGDGLELAEGSTAPTSQGKRVSLRPELTEAQRQETPQAFELFDADGTGTIDVKEL